MYLFLTTIQQKCLISHSLSFLSSKLTNIMRTMTQQPARYNRHSKQKNRPRPDDTALTTFDSLMQSWTKTQVNCQINNRASISLFLQRPTQRMSTYTQQPTTCPRSRPVQDLLDTLLPRTIRQLSFIRQIKPDIKTKPLAFVILA